MFNLVMINALLLHVDCGQSLTNTFTPILLVRLDERTGNLFILAGDNIEIEIYPNGFWRFL